MHRANYIQHSFSSGRRARKADAIRRALDHTLEPLESRRLYSVTATSAGSVLTILGDNNANVITVSRDQAGNLLVNNGAVQIVGPTATVANTTSINVSGLGGNDNIALDETNGALPKASLSGGSGNDMITGGSGADILNGNDGNDALFGKAGNDQLFGGDGNDNLTGGIGTDQAFGQGGNDRMIWNPGEGSDTNEGGAGNDTVVVIGGGIDETFTVTANGTRVRFDRTSPGPFSIDIGTSENLMLNAGAGNDSFVAGNGLAQLIRISVDGGAGDDRLLGGDGNDTLSGGDGNDFIDGNGGADTAFLGNGKDSFTWDPGDGSDIVHGQGGQDAMVFNGNDANEIIDMSNRLGHLRFTRNVGNIVMDTDGVEAVEFKAFGGADKVTVHDLSGTGVTQVDLDLDSARLTGNGDNMQDSVIVEGRNSADLISVESFLGFSGGSEIDMTGLPATVSVTGADVADKLTVKSLGGDDVINATGLAARLISFTADGGTGNDVVVGSAGDDTLLGGEGNDILIGGPGNDQINGGAGNNTVLQ